MPVAIATPGVAASAAKAAVSDTDDPTVVRATRCGRIPLARHRRLLVVCVRSCTVSIHSAQLVVDSLPPGATPTICVVDTATVPRWLRRQFDCPVRALPSNDHRRATLTAENGD